MENPSCCSSPLALGQVASLRDDVHSPAGEGRHGQALGEVGTQRRGGHNHPHSFTDCEGTRVAPDQAGINEDVLGRSFRSVWVPRLASQPSGVALEDTASSTRSTLDPSRAI